MRAADSLSVADPAISLDEQELAVAKALGARRGVHLTNPAYHELPRAELAARVRGRLVPLAPGRDGWWLVGRITDELEGAEFCVWFMKGSSRIGLSRDEGDGVIGDG